jgi:hypothetical protein
VSDHIFLKNVGNATILQGYVPIAAFSPALFFMKAMIKDIIAAKNIGMIKLYRLPAQLAHAAIMKSTTAIDDVRI